MGAGGLEPSTSGPCLTPFRAALGQAVTLLSSKRHHLRRRAVPPAPRGPTEPLEATWSRHPLGTMGITRPLLPRGGGDHLSLVGRRQPERHGSPWAAQAPSSAGTRSAPEKPSVQGLPSHRDRGSPSQTESSSSSDSPPGSAEQRGPHPGTRAAKLQDLPKRWARPVDVVSDMSPRRAVDTGMGSCKEKKEQSCPTCKAQRSWIT